MPPPDRAAPGSPADWLARANGDLALAFAPLLWGAFREDLCFHAQQAAEKALKAIYLHQGWRFRYVHDLGELVTGLEQQGLVVPDEVKACFVLTVFASETRYPRFGEPVTEHELEEAAGDCRPRRPLGGVLDPRQTSVTRRDVPTAGCARTNCCGR